MGSKQIVDDCMDYSTILVPCWKQPAGLSFVKAEIAMTEDDSFAPLRSFPYMLTRGSGYEIYVLWPTWPPSDKGQLKTVSQNVVWFLRWLNQFVQIRLHEKEFWFPFKLPVEEEKKLKLLASWTRVILYKRVNGGGGFFVTKSRSNRLNFPWQSSSLKFDSIITALRNHLRHSDLLEVQDSAIRHLNKRDWMSCCWLVLSIMAPLIRSRK